MRIKSERRKNIKNKMMLENQIISIENTNCDYDYELLDSNLPAIDKLTSATSVNHAYKYWNPATESADYDLNSNYNNKFNNAAVHKGELEINAFMRACVLDSTKK